MSNETYIYVNNILNNLKPLHVCMCRHMYSFFSIQSAFTTKKIQFFLSTYEPLRILIMQIPNDVI